MTRQAFATRKILVRGPEQVERAIALLRSLPVDTKKPLEVVVREEVKARKLDQNALMWVGPLKDIAEQAWVDQRQHCEQVWHEFFKREFLPDEYDPDMCKEESYRKWAIGIDGEPVLVGSTTELTVKGFAQYLEQVYAFGANLGVEFHAKHA